VRRSVTAHHLLLKTPSLISSPHVLSQKTVVSSLCSPPGFMVCKIFVAYFLFSAFLHEAPTPFLSRLSGVVYGFSSFSPLSLRSLQSAVTDNSPSQCDRYAVQPNNLVSSGRFYPCCFPVPLFVKYGTSWIFLATRGTSCRLISSLPLAASTISLLLP